MIELLILCNTPRQILNYFKTKINSTCCLVAPQLGGGNCGYRIHDDTERASERATLARPGGGRGQMNRVGDEFRSETRFGCDALYNREQTAKFWHGRLENFSASPAPPPLGQQAVVFNNIKS